MRNLWIPYKNSSGIDSRPSVLIAPDGIEMSDREGRQQCRCEF